MESDLILVWKADKAETLSDIIIPLLIEYFQINFCGAGKIFLFKGQVRDDNLTAGMQARAPAFPLYSAFSFI